tara:strand:- start:265 stop:1251 length:987 start_codon:yes stop_codon:yes gene_type:complete
MRHGSLFSGIGGFDLAAEWMGWENVFHCEWNEFGQKILKHHFPKADSYSDITKTDFRKYEGTIDIISGGFPCQPFSLAGKRKGTEDERYLWHEMLRAVQEIKPKFVIAENVYGIVNIDEGMVFEQVCLDLEAEGYEVQPFVIPACAKNAPHIRARVWFVAFKNPHQDGRRGNKRKEKSSKRKFRNISSGDNERIQTNNNKTRTASNPNYSRTINGLRDNENGETSNEGRKKQSRYKLGPVSEDASNPNGGGGIQDNIELEARKSKYACASWEAWPTQSPICRRDDGLSERLDGITFPKWRSESIKAYGNAIVPQVAFEIFKALNENIS